MDHDSPSQAKTFLPWRTWEMHRIGVLLARKWGKWLLGWHLLAHATFVFCVSWEPGTPLRAGDSLSDRLLNDAQRMGAKSWWMGFDVPDGVGDFAQKRKAQPSVFFSFVIITWYCPFNSWGNSTSRCTASDSYWFEWLSRARLIGPRDWNNDSAGRGEPTRQSLFVCWRAGFAATLAHSSRELSGLDLTAILSEGTAGLRGPACWW